MCKIQTFIEITEQDYATTQTYTLKKKSVSLTASNIGSPPVYSHHFE